MSSRDSIFFSSLRALCVAFFSIVGIAVGILVVMIVWISVAFSGSKEVGVSGNYAVLPDANGQIAPLSRQSPLILRLDIVGLIGSKTLSAEKVRDQLQRSQQGALAGRIRGLMVHINSPGGSAFDSNGIYSAIMEYKKRYQIPVCVWIDGLCASGGVYSAAAGDKVYASDVSLVGSVGVLATFFNATETLQKIGVEVKTITRGKNKAAMSPFKIWEPGEDQGIQDIIEYLYGQFVDVVVAARPRIHRQQLIEDYGANVFAAPIAQEIGFIDGILPDQGEALRRLAAEAGVGDQYQVIQLDAQTWLQSLFGTECLFPKTVTHEVSLPGFNSQDRLEGFLYLYKPATI